MTDIDIAIAKASSEIAGVLSRLEQQSGKRVASIGLQSIDVTRFEDTRKRLITEVVIELEDPFTREWSVASSKE